MRPFSQVWARKQKRIRQPAQAGYARKLAPLLRGVMPLISELLALEGVELAGDDRGSAIDDEGVAGDFI